MARATLKNVNGLPQCPHMKDRRTSKYNLLTTCTPTHDSNHLPFPELLPPPTPPLGTRRRLPLRPPFSTHRARQAARLRWEPTAQSDATVNKAKYLKFDQGKVSMRCGASADDSPQPGDRFGGHSEAFDLTRLQLQTLGTNKKLI